MSLWDCSVCHTPFPLPEPDEERVSCRCPKCGLQVLLAGRRELRKAAAARQPTEVYQRIKALR